MRKGLFSKNIAIVLSLGWMLTFGGGVSLCQSLPPVFDPVPGCFVNQPDSDDLQLSAGRFEGQTFTTCTCFAPEGETLDVRVHATDPDGAVVHVSVMNAPATARFLDLGKGRASLVWVPEFLGPLSAAGNPFEVFFVASNESLSTRLRVSIHVDNVNRNPELVLPDSSEVAAGSQLVFQVRTTDLDLEKVKIQALSLPPGASFAEGLGVFSWTPELADTGIWSVAFRGSDPSGGECLKQTQIRVTRPSTYRLSLGVEECLLGSTVEVPISLLNSDPVSGIDLQVRYEPSELTFLGVSRQGCRTENWEYFTYGEKTVGQNQLVKIVGIADFPNQVQTAPLAPDSGVIAYLSFRVTSNPDLNGFLLSLDFWSLDLTDNAFSSPRGKFITHQNITLSPGGILLNSMNTLVGDINQNGIAFEIADAVKLAAYLSGRTVLSPQQLINSDVNQDGHMASLADFVFLINHILRDGSPPQGGELPAGEAVAVRISDEPLPSGQSGFRTSVGLESGKPIGGALVVFKGQNLRVENVRLSPEEDSLDLHTSQVGDEFRVLVVSSEAKPLPVGIPLLRIEGEGLDTIQVSLSDEQGELLRAEQQREPNSLPTRYALYQNYPNPFNPATNIRYFVGDDCPVRVSLRIYNVAGQLVKTLVNDERPRGEYVQTWDGKNENNDDVASGVYFYKLRVSNYVETKKMVLLR